jgi:hypothetical protein
MLLPCQVSYEWGEVMIPINIQKNSSVGVILDKKYTGVPSNYM